MSGRLVVGTSSWADPGFVAEWYPRGMPARERLGWYAERFEAVELNSSFYAIPDERLVPHPVAIELRNRNWAGEQRLEDTLRWLSEHGAVWVGVDAPPAEPFSIMPPIDAATRDDLAYLRAHSHNVEGYLHGKSVAE